MSKIVVKKSTPEGRKDIKVRAITALFFVIVIMTCLFNGMTPTLGLILAIIILGAYELSKMLDPRYSRISTYLHIFFAATPLLLLHQFKPEQPIILILAGLSALIHIFLISNLWSQKRLGYAKYRYLFTMTYWGLPFCLTAYYILRNPAFISNVLIGVIIILWSSDVMAYLVGRKIGQRKLFPSVSPGKSVEGSVGAGIFSIVAAIGYSYFSETEMLPWIFYGIVIWIVGTLGDLVESKLKRTVDIKDSGNLLPGHGGFLDRFDSLVMVLPFLLLLDMIF